MPERREGREPIVHLVRKANNLLEVLRSLPYRNDDRSFQTPDPELALRVFRKERAMAGLIPESYLPACLTPESEKSF